MHHGRFSNKRLELVYTKYEVNRSIIKGCVPIQPDNLVFSTLTTDSTNVLARVRGQKQTQNTF